MSIDLEKRRRVMQRSIKLGHCICDPKQPCPCDLFKEREICLCAGERLEPPEGDVGLTQLVENAGCASKIDKASLQSILAGLPSLDDPNVLVGMPAGDDAGVYRLDEDTALVQTVDVFSPSVDDPYTFGQIAAANSLSDVYAMGGRPVTALSIVGFPLRKVPDRVLHEILRGGIDTMREAGVPVVGGHSIKDNEIKAGFAVTGVVDPNRIVTNAGAAPGDVLVLTKPLGTGVLSFAAQIDRAPKGAAEAIAESMAALNRAAAELMIAHGAHACTDVTGFGLMGHLGEMARSSGVDVEIVWDDLPVFDGLIDCLASGIVPGGIERNRESSREAADPAEGVTEAMLDVCFDPQTSGGLVIALPDKKADGFVSALRDKGVLGATIVGRVAGVGSGRVIVRTTGHRNWPKIVDESKNETILPSVPDVQHSTARAEVSMNQDNRSNEPDVTECCAHDSDEMGAVAAGAAGAKQAFGRFLNAANTPDRIDVVNKKLMAIALSVLSRCEPCLKAHVKKALEMGISRQEIDEAAWMAISFGGSPTMMFYNETMEVIGVW